MTNTSSCSRKRSRCSFGIFIAWWCFFSSCTEIILTCWVGAAEEDDGESVGGRFQLVGGFKCHLHSSSEEIHRPAFFYLGPLLTSVQRLVHPDFTQSDLFLFPVSTFSRGSGCDEERTSEGFGSCMRSGDGRLPWTQGEESAGVQLAQVR